MNKPKLTLSEGSRLSEESNDSILSKGNVELFAPLQRNPTIRRIVVKGLSNKTPTSSSLRNSPNRHKTLRKKSSGKTGFEPNPYDINVSMPINGFSISDLKYKNQNIDIKTTFKGIAEANILEKQIIDIHNDKMVNVAKQKNHLLKQKKENTKEKIALTKHIENAKTQFLKNKKLKNKKPELIEKLEEDFKKKKFEGSIIDQKTISKQNEFKEERKIYEEKNIWNQEKIMQITIQLKLKNDPNSIYIGTWSPNHVGTAFFLGNTTFEDENGLITRQGIKVEGLSENIEGTDAGLLIREGPEDVNSFLFITNNGFICSNNEDPDLIEVGNCYNMFNAKTGQILNINDNDLILNLKKHKNRNAPTVRKPHPLAFADEGGGSRRSRHRNMHRKSINRKSINRKSINRKSKKIQNQPKKNKTKRRR